MKESSKNMRLTMREQFKNQPNLELKGTTFDAEHLVKFIVRPKTASTKTASTRYRKVSESGI